MIISSSNTVSFHNFNVCVCGLDSGNLKFETVRTHKQTCLLFRFETLDLKFCDLKLWKLTVQVQSKVSKTLSAAYWPAFDEATHVNVDMRVCILTCMYVCMCVYIYIYIYICCMCVYISLSLYIYIYIERYRYTACMYVYIYIYIYIYR